MHANQPVITFARQANSTSWFLCVTGSDDVVTHCKNIRIRKSSLKLRNSFFFWKCVSSFRCRHNIPLLSSKRYIHNPFEFLCFIFSVLSQSVNAEIIQTYYTRQHIPISCKRECTTNGTSSRCEWHLHFVVKPRLSSTMILWDIQGPVPI